MDAYLSIHDLLPLTRNGTPSLNALPLRGSPPQGTLKREGEEKASLHWIYPDTREKVAEVAMASKRDIRTVTHDAV